jgi:hypothetical protein
MARTMPSREAVSQQIREFSRTKGMAITAREYASHPERLCSVDTVANRLFHKSWNGVLTECGIMVRDYKSPEQIIAYILTFYCQERRWPQVRDFKKPCSHSVVRKVLRSSENAVATAVQLAQEKLRVLEAEGIPLADFLARMLITATPQPVPSASPMKLAEALIVGRPTGYEFFPFAPQWENDVLALFHILVGAGKLPHKFIIESVRPGRFPDCKAKEYVRSRGGYIDVRIEFELRSADFLKHGHENSANRCDYIICWQDNWPKDGPRPAAQILPLQDVLAVIASR